MSPLPQNLSSSHSADSWSLSCLVVRRGGNAVLVVHKSEIRDPKLPPLGASRLNVAIFLQQFRKTGGKAAAGHDLSATGVPRCLQSVGCHMGPERNHRNRQAGLKAREEFGNVQSRIRKINENAPKGFGARQLGRSLRVFSHSDF